MSKQENKKDKMLDFSKAQCESFGHKSGIDLWFNDIADFGDRYASGSE